MLRRYETLILAVPEVTQDEAKKMEKEVDRLVQEAKGATISFEKWGKYRLAFPVKKNDYGVYFLARFEVPQGTKLTEEVKTLFAIKLNNFVMRTVITQLDPEGSLAYQRPKSLEEVPGARGDVGSFIKEQKVEGLLSAVDSAKENKTEKASVAPEKVATAVEAKTESKPEAETEKVEKTDAVETSTESSKN